MRNPILRSMLLAAAVGCTTIAFAAGAQQAPAKASPPANQAAQPQQRTTILDELDLTDKQKDSVREMVQQSMAQARSEMEALQQKRMTLENATPGTSQYKAAATDLANAESTAVRAQVLRQADLGTRIYNMLTAEQRTKFATLRAQRQQQMQQQAQPPASH
ncbi:MAG: Spy/CpxP family protein refolding chaperone [Rhodanobacteraceae bacterium]